MLGTSSVHGPGLYPVRVAKLNEMPILPLRSLQFSDREKDHHYVHYNFEVKKSFRRDKDKHSASPGDKGITEGLLIWLKMWGDR